MAESALRGRIRRLRPPGLRLCHFLLRYHCSRQSPAGYLLQSSPADFRPFRLHPQLQTFTGNFNYEPTNIKHGMVQQYNVDLERSVDSVTWC